MTRACRPLARRSLALLAAAAFAFVSACAGAAERPAAAAPATPAVATTNQCLECHRKEKEDRLVAPTRGFDHDVHAQRGLGCVGCHGGDPNDPDITGMDPDKGYVGKPGRKEIAALCEKCHADAAYMKRFNPQPYVFSVAEFLTSVHAKKMAAGDLKAATCINCHGVHPILSPRDPNAPVYAKNVPATCAHCHNAEYMKGRSLPTNQYELYQHSVHGEALLVKGDLSAPACNDCHGNHGAVPPNTRDISIVCGNCHGREGELFAGSKVSRSLELEGKRGCVTCHGNHGVRVPTDAMIGNAGEGVCGKCHDPGSAGDKASAVIVPGFNDLRTRIATADSLLRLAEVLGMPTEKSREFLKQATDQVVSTRVTLHSFDSKQIQAAIGEGDGFARQAVAAGQRALKDWRTRRVGMGWSVVAIAMVIVLLVLKIRQVERNVSTPDGGGS
jgi:predicted CXXCH cytochrome family protein